MSTTTHMQHFHLTKTALIIIILIIALLLVITLLSYCVCHPQSGQIDEVRLEEEMENRAFSDAWHRNRVSRPANVFLVTVTEVAEDDE